MTLEEKVSQIMNAAVLIERLGVPAYEWWNEALRGDRTIREVAESFGVGTTFGDKVLALHRAGSDLAPRPHGGGYPARLLPRHEKLLRSEVRRRKDSTLEELRAHLEAEASL